MEPFIGISYKLIESHNFDEYMKALGVGLLTRKLGNTLTPTIKLTGPVKGEYTLHTTSTFNNHQTKFKIGVEFDQHTVDGRAVKSVVTFEKNKMIEVQKDKRITTTIVREFGPDQMKATLTVGDVTCTRFYNKID